MDFLFGRAFKSVAYFSGQSQITNSNEHYEQLQQPGLQIHSLAKQNNTIYS